MEIASRVYLWFADLVVRCLCFIEVWWRQREWDKKKRGEFSGSKGLYSN